jgi:hypothetical protein
MSIADAVLEQLHIEHGELLRFVGMFSRCECALKESGMFMARDKIIVPDWSRLTAELDSGFDAGRTQELSAACAYLLNRPPRKQIIKGGRIQWVDFTPDPAATALKNIIEAVKVTRNNLMHGGKWHSGPLDEPGRDGALLRAGIVILEESVRLSEACSRKFHDAFSNGVRFPRRAAA